MTRSYFIVIVAALLTAVLGLLALTPVRAAAGVLDIPGLATLVAEKAKEARACAVVDLNGKFAGGAYLPVWTFHKADDPKTQYVNVGIGGVIRQGESFRPFVPVAANLPALSAKLWDSDWARRHLTRTKFPPIWVGPQVRVPLPGERVGWGDWREWLGFIAAVGF